MSLLWKIGGAAVALVAAYFLVTMYGRARYQEGRSVEAASWQGEATKAEQAKFAAYRLGLQQRDAAQTIYRETITRLQPIEQRIIERTTDYARTPAGRALCLAADRVRGIEQTRAALFPATAAPDPGGAPRALPANAAANGR